MNIGMNTEFRVKLTPKVDKAVYSKNLPMPIHMKEDLIVELALKFFTNPSCCLAAASGEIPGEFKLVNFYNDSTAETD